MPFHPNAVFLSPSSLGDFDKCPKLYYYRYVYKSPDTGLKVQIINPALALGQAVHDTLERFLALEPGQRSETQLQETFATVWKTLGGEKGGFSHQEEEETFRKRGEIMLSNFFAHPHFKTSAKAKLPDFPKIDLGDDLFLTGKLDWIEKEGEGYHVVDFKTGQNEEREGSMQLPIYALLAGKIFNTNDVKTSYWYLDKDKDLVPFSLPEMEEFAKEMKRKGLIIKKSRLTNSFACPKGESCWACRDMAAVVVHGKGKLVTIDAARKQEIYILPKEDLQKESTEAASDLPF